MHAAPRATHANPRATAHATCAAKRLAFLCPMSMSICASSRSLLCLKHYACADIQPLKLHTFSSELITIDPQHLVSPSLRNSQ